MEALADVSIARELLHTLSLGRGCTWATNLVASTQTLLATVQPGHASALVIEPLMRTLADVDACRSQQLRLSGLLDVLVEHLPATLPVLNALVRVDDANAVSLVDSQHIWDRLAAQEPTPARTALAEILAEQYEECAPGAALLDCPDVLDALM